MKVFVTSNQQFGRPSAIKAYKRPFHSVDEMNNALIEAWNSVVSPEDIVYVLGNFAWDPEIAEKTINALNGDIVVISGEFDKATAEISELLSLTSIDYLYNSIEEHPEANIVMSYWPLLDWPGKARGSYSIIGHPNKKYKTNHKTRIINCSCDNWEFKPIEATKLIDLFNEVSE
jgi:calcineurin-like phosphoesterase family protein